MRVSRLVILRRCKLIFLKEFQNTAVTPAVFFDGQYLELCAIEGIEGQKTRIGIIETRRNKMNETPNSSLIINTDNTWQSEPDPFIGGDQQPLLRGVLRALVMRHHFPSAPLVYEMHDGDVLGNRDSNENTTKHLVPWNGKGWCSWSNTFPFTPRIHGVESKVASKLHDYGFPPAHLKVSGGDSNKLIVDSIFDEIIVAGLHKEIDWALEMGGAETRGNELRVVINNLRDKPVRASVQSIVNHILLAEKLPSLPIGSVVESMNDLRLQKYEHLLPQDWRWENGLPRAQFLIIELALRGTLFCTNIPYWEESAQYARERGISIPKPIRIEFDAPIPDLKIWDKRVKPSFTGHQTAKNLAIEYWRKKPTLIFSHLMGTLHSTIESATLL